MIDYEQLSRLLDEDLPPEEARALRERIQQDPEWRAAWEQLRALPTALASLPSEPPPRSVREAALSLPAAPVPAPAWGRRMLPALGLAAALLLGLALWPSPPELLLTEGEQLVDGRARVLVGDVAVDVDGRALLRVEPPGAAARVSSAEGPDMSLKTVGAALSGALVTVAVYEGSALLHSAEGAPVAVHAGQTRAMRGGEPTPTTAPTKAPARPGAPPAEPATLEEARAEIAALRQELAAARLEGAVSRGQLSQEIGAPQPWPSDAVAAVRPDVWEKNLAEALARHGAGQIVAIDCQEYPCVAVLEPAPGAEDWKGAFEDSFHDLSESRFDDKASVHAMVSSTRDEDGEQNLMGVAIYPGGDGDDQSLRDRTNYRLSALLEDEGGEGR